MFINYFNDDRRRSALNLAVARFTLGSVVLWKLLSYNWNEFSDWPWFIFEKYPYGFLVFSQTHLQYIQIEVWITALFLVMFALGYRIAVSGYMSSLLLIHLLAIHTAVTNIRIHHIFALLFLLFTMYRKQDKLSIDALRRTKDMDLQEINEFVQSGPENYPHTALKWSLVYISLIYFMVIFNRIRTGGIFEWMTYQNMNRIVLWQTLIHGMDLPFLAEMIVAFPVLGTLLGWFTVIAEGSFLFVVLIGLPITPSVLAVMTVHTGIALTMGLFFFDTYLALCLLLAFDRAHARLLPDDEIDVMYDGTSRIHARSLVPFKSVDPDGIVNFYTQSTAPSEYQEREDINLDGAVYVCRNGETYRGVDAYRELSVHLRLYPLIALMRLPYAEDLATRIYNRAADEDVPTHAVRDG